MIVLVLAPPSRHARPLVDAVRLLAAADGAVDYFHLSTLEKFRESWAGRGKDRVVLFLDCPDAALSRVLAHAAVPVIRLAEDPLESARFLRGQDRSPEAATRTAATCYAALHDIVCAANNMLSVAPASFQTPDLLADRLADFLGATPAGRSAAGASLRAAATLPTPFVEASRDIEAYADALASYRPLEAPQPVDAIEFPATLFQTTAPMGALYQGDEIELLGPARILLFGPYLHAPAGRWRARARIEIADNLSGNILKVEALSGHDLLAQSLGPLPAQGAFDCAIDLEIGEPREPVQLRISTQQGAIEGSLRLVGCRLHRLAE